MESSLSDGFCLGTVHVIRRGDEQRDIQYSEDKVRSFIYQARSLFVYKIAEVIVHSHFTLIR